MVNAVHETGLEPGMRHVPDAVHAHNRAVILVAIEASASPGGPDVVGPVTNVTALGGGR